MDRTMKAAVVRRRGAADFEIATQPVPDPGPGQVLVQVQVQAASVNFSDVKRRRGDPDWPERVMSHQGWWAARAYLYERAGQTAEAVTCCFQAIELTSDPRLIASFEARIARLRSLH